jgi:hypothetical protein
MKKNIYLMADGAEGGAAGAAGTSGAAGGAAGAASGSVLGAAGGAAAPTDWRSTLPDDVKADPSLASFKDVGSLAKSYIHAQKLVGADKIPAPQKNWTPEQWTEHYERLGRPKDAKEYGFPKEFKAPEGLNLDDASLGKAREVFHKVGLTKQQGEAVLALYGETAAQGLALQQESAAEAKRTTMAALEGEWKSSTQLKLQLAQAAVVKYGGQELMEYLNESGLGNNPQLIKAFATIGEKVSEDGVGGQGLVLPTSGAAAAELERLGNDPAFQEALNNNAHPGHKSAVDRRLNLFKLTAG